MIAPLTEQDWQTNEGIAARMNEVIDVVNALDGIAKWLTQHVGRWVWEEHEAAREGGQAADGEDEEPTP